MEGGLPQVAICHGQQPTARRRLVRSGPVKLAGSRHMSGVGTAWESQAEHGWEVLWWLAGSLNMNRNLHGVGVRRMAHGAGTTLGRVGYAKSIGPT